MLWKKKSAMGKFWLAAACCSMLRHAAACFKTPTNSSQNLALWHAACCGMLLPLVLVRHLAPAACLHTAFIAMSLPNAQGGGGYQLHNTDRPRPTNRADGRKECTLRSIALGQPGMCVPFCVGLVESRGKRCPFAHRARGSLRCRILHVLRCALDARPWPSWASSLTNRADGSKWFASYPVTLPFSFVHPEMHD